MKTTITPPTTTRTAEAGRPSYDQSRAAPAVRAIDDAATSARWGDYVARATDGSFFHHPDWCACVAATFGHRPRHLCATRGDEIVGVLPLMEVNSLLAGRMLISVPYATYGGILADDTAVTEALTHAATELAQARRARVLELRSACAAVPSFDPIAGYLGFVGDLPARAEDVPATIPRKARAAARQARDRAGVIVQHDSSLLRTVWDLYCRSMRRLGSLNYPLSFFERLQQRLGSRLWVSVAWQAGRPVFGVISFVFGDTLLPYVSGADERIRCDGAANLLYWSLRERGVNSGLRRFDYGRSRADNKGAAGFKKNQGFEPFPLGYQRFVPPGRKPPNLKPTNPRFAAARRIWPRLPLPLTRALGVWLSKSVPG